MRQRKTRWAADETAAAGVGMTIVFEAAQRVGLTLEDEALRSHGFVDGCRVWDESVWAVVDSRMTLAVCHADNVADCAARHAGLIMLVLAQSESRPIFGDDIEGRLVVARKRTDARLSQSAIASLLDAAVRHVLAWSRVLGAIKPPGTLQDLVDLAGEELAGSIVVLDACNEISAYKVAGVGNSVDASELERLRLEGLNAISCESDELAGQDVAMTGSCEARVLPCERGGLAVAEMSCSSVSYGRVFLFSEGEESFVPASLTRLSIFAHRCASLAARSDGSGLSADQRRLRLLDHLVEEKNMDIMALGRESTATGVSLEGPCRLILFDGTYCASSSALSLMLFYLQERFPEHVVFTHAGEALLLVKEPVDNMCLDSAFLKELDSFARQHQCCCYSSDTVESLMLLWYAYDEVVSCRVCKHDILVGRAPWSCQRCFSDRVFQFYEAVSYFRSAELIDSVFLNESYRMLPLQKVIDYDRRNNTDDLTLLYCYLALEQGVSATAQRIHMHRNNVRHRIDAIKDRYGFDLSDAFVRTRLLNDYRLLVSRSPDFAKAFLQRLG